jgi:hypothetical protein
MNDANSPDDAEPLLRRLARRAGIELDYENARGGPGRL